MRKLVFLLGIATMGLTIACGYFYRQLQDERSRNDALEAEVMARAGGIAMPASAPLEDELSAPSEDFEDPKQPPGISPDPPHAGPADSEAVRVQRLAERREQLQQRWSDPAFRSQALVRIKHQTRRGNPDVGSALRLNAAEESAFLDLLAQQRLQLEEAKETMRLASDVERRSIQQQVNALALQHEQELAAQLGSVRYQEYQEYSRQIPERQQLQELRSRLDEASSMSTAQASRLVDAMYRERDSYVQQMKTTENFGGYSPQYPIQAVSKDRDPVARLRFAEEQVTRTEEFMGRLRLRASEVLSSEQLRRFDEIQEEQLAMAQSQVERIRNQANRRSARGPRATQ
jgi:hypothetical protein